MGKKNRDKSKQKTAERNPKSRSSNKTLLIVAGILILLGVVYAFSHRRGTTTTTPPPVPVNVDALPGIQTGEAPWPIELNDLRDRLKIIGLPALLEEGTAQHAHQHLDLFIKGKSMAIPAFIGINVPERFITPIHTHDTTGEIHIESPTVRSYNLGQFFDIWGVRFTAKCIGSYCEDQQNAIKVFVDGRAVPGDPRLLQLKDHLEIVIAYGTSQEWPNPIPARYSFPAGS